MAVFRILSLDGGGVRGAFAAGYLAEIESRCERPIGEYFDLIAGTSTGGIIAAGLAAGLRAGEITSFYRSQIPRIFQPRTDRHWPFWCHAVGGLLKAVCRQADGPRWEDLFQSRYCPQELRAALKIALGTRSMADLKGPRLLIPAVNLSLGQTCLFRTPHLPIRHQERNWHLVDVLLAATAAPTYFPHKVLPNGLAYVDGGLWATSPSLLAFAEAMKIRQLCQRPQCDPQYDTSEIHVLSIGAGRPRFSLTPPGSAAGILYWSLRAADVMGNAQVEGVNAPMEFLLGSRYRRIDFAMRDSTWQLDNAAIVDELIEMGHREAGRNDPGSLRDFFQIPTAPYAPFWDDN
ncbi:MAG: CBASS cGAMP-activated phospholipase [Planctomycetota bacterium]|nr:CBASS cGAMP-activated phospholipase [Planctomycetota bacterium]